MAGKFGLLDYEKMFCPDPHADDIFQLRGLNRETGCMVVVRPDQYVSHVLPLHGHGDLADFFAGILIDATYGPPRQDGGRSSARARERLLPRRR
jgi:phenol 2-monooxygenase (NADPH)